MVTIKTVRLGESFKELGPVSGPDLAANLLHDLEAYELAVQVCPAVHEAELRLPM